MSSRGQDIRTRKGHRSHMSKSIPRRMCHYKRTTRFGVIWAGITDYYYKDPRSK